MNVDPRVDPEIILGLVRDFTMIEKFMEKFIKLHYFPEKVKYKKKIGMTQNHVISFNENPFLLV